MYTSEEYAQTGHTDNSEVGYADLKLTHSACKSYSNGNNT